MSNKFFLFFIFIVFIFPINISNAYFDPLKCGIFIQKKQKVNGYDVKKETMECAWKTLKKGGGERLYKICMRKKMSEKIQDKDLEKIINKTWTIVKKACT